MLILPFHVKHCPFCGVYVKPENLGRHIQRVHPQYAYGVDKILIPSEDCPICGRRNLSKARYGLPICDEHYVKDSRKFLIKNFYLKLKKKNNAELASDPEAAFWALNSQLHMINNLLGWEPEKINESRFLMFNEASAFTGYFLLRLIEAVPNVEEVMYTVASSNKTVQESEKLRAKIAKLLILLDAEFELFLAIKFAATGYYDIAVDDEQSPSIILIVPSTTEKSIQNLLLMRLRDANEQWHGTFRRVAFPYGTSSARDEYGVSFTFDRSKIKDHFEVFEQCWNEVFHTCTRLTAADFEKLWDWLEWVVSEDGITVENQGHATYFADYRDFDLEKDLIFEVLDEVLPEVHERLDLSSPKELSKSDPYLLEFFRLADLARGFRVLTPKGVIYYFPCRKWFYNKLTPVFIKFCRKLGISGECFEKDVHMFFNFYSKVGIKLGGKSALGIMIEPRPIIPKCLKVITSRSNPWKVLETNYRFSLSESSLSKSIGKSGEIDLIVYANMNLYLIELKALNFESRQAIKYLREKAPLQCAKYAAWVREQSQFENFLRRHGIREDQLNSVRIVICSSGAFYDLYAECKETGERFAIVPEYVLFSTMAGFFTLSLKEPFPTRIENIAAGLKIVSERIPRIAMVDINREIRKKVSEELISWIKLITFDRRQEYMHPIIDEHLPEAISFFESTLLMNEFYLGNTTKWILPKPLLVKEVGKYKFYLGTQLGDAGTTIVCDNCKSAIKFYWPREENADFEKIQAMVSSSKCLLCGKPLTKSNDSTGIKRMMAMIMSKLKYEISVLAY